MTTGAVEKHHNYFFGMPGSQAFRDGYDRIFRKKKSKRSRKTGAKRGGTKK